MLKPMRPKAGGLAKHGGPPDWLKENDPTGVILYVPLAFSGAAQLRADGISSCCYIVNVKTLRNELCLARNA
jgi:hypothetical protein